MWITTVRFIYCSISSCAEAEKNVLRDSRRPRHRKFKHLRWRFELSNSTLYRSARSRAKYQPDGFALSLERDGSPCESQCVHIIWLCPCLIPVAGSRESTSGQFSESISCKAPVTEGLTSDSPETPGQEVLTAS